MTFLIPNKRFGMEESCRIYTASITALKGQFTAILSKFVNITKSDMLMQMKRHMTVIIYSSFRPGLSRKQKCRLLTS